MSGRKTQIAGPLDPVLGFNYGGIALLVVADLAEAHAISFSKRSEAGMFDAAVPGVECVAGTMVVLIPPNVADQIRPALKQAEKQLRSQMLGTGQVDSAHLPKGTLA